MSRHKIWLSGRRAVYRERSRGAARRRLWSGARKEENQTDGKRSVAMNSIQPVSLQPNTQPVSA